MEYRSFTYEERRKLSKLRTAIKYAVDPQRHLLISMARMLGPDRLKQLEDSLRPGGLKPRMRGAERAPCQELNLSKKIREYLRREDILSLRNLCALTDRDVYWSCPTPYMHLKIDRELRRICRKLKPRKEKIDASTPCSHLALSEYSRNRLAKASIATVGDLCRLGSRNLAGVVNQNNNMWHSQLRQLLAEIKLELARHGIPLKD